MTKGWEVQECRANDFVRVGECRERRPLAKQSLCACLFWMYRFLQVLSDYEFFLCDILQWLRNLCYYSLSPSCDNFTPFSTRRIMKWNVWWFLGLWSQLLYYLTPPATSANDAKLTVNPTLFTQGQQVVTADLLTFSSPKFTTGYNLYIRLSGSILWIPLDPASPGMFFPPTALAQYWWYMSLPPGTYYFKGRWTGSTTGWPTPWAIDSNVVTAFAL